MRLSAVMAILMPSVCFGGMSVYVTDKCSEHQHPEITFDVEDTVPEIDARWMKSTLEEMVSSGSRFKAGQTLQIGWMILRFEDSGKGTLALHEPDMQRMPIKYVKSVTRTLRSVRAQKDTAESFGLLDQLSFPTFLHVIGVPEDLNGISAVQLHREVADGQMSGWYLIDAAGGTQKFRPMSMYELSLTRPDLIKFFALPAGTDILISSTGEIKAFAEQKPLEAREGSFIDGLNRAAATRSR